MDIDAITLLKILNKNFNFEIVKTPYGDAVKMTDFDAFIYCNVTGAGYLTHYAYPFSPKGLMKIFYNAFDYKPVTGIFDNLSFKHTPYQLSKLKNFLFDGQYKYVIPIEFDNESELFEKQKKILASIHENNENPTNYIIQRIETYKKGNGLEPFMEYLACEYFKNNGFIVENQIPLTATVGSPDFGGYILESYPLLSQKTGKGFHIIELALLRLHKNMKENMISNNNSCFIVGEAKTSTKYMERQMHKYVNTGLFSAAYEIHPDKLRPSNKYFGLFRIKSNYQLELLESHLDKYDFSNQPVLFDRKKYNDWLSNYFKFYLIANFTTDEFYEYASMYGYQLNSINDFVKFVSTLTFENIMDKIRGL